VEAQQRGFRPLAEVLRVVASRASGAAALPGTELSATALPVTALPAPALPVVVLPTAAESIPIEPAPETLIRASERLGGVPGSAGRSGATGRAVADLCDGFALARLAALEAYERATRHLLERFAREVLARELALAPADLAAVARSALGAFASEEPVAIAVSPGDATMLSCDVPVRIDDALEAGDIVVLVRDGIVDLRLDVRIAAALEAAATWNGRS
jgi:hypothetical protein